MGQKDLFVKILEYWGLVCKFGRAFKQVLGFKYDLVTFQGRIGIFPSAEGLFVRGLMS